MHLSVSMKINLKENKQEQFPGCCGMDAYMDMDASVCLNENQFKR